MRTLSLLFACLASGALLIGACGAREAAPPRNDSPTSPTSEPVGGLQTPSPGAENARAQAGPAEYDFSNPDASFELPAELLEISGLTVLPDGNLAAVQDEHGTVYIVDAESGAVTERHEFAGPGDYEGIELVGDRLFVLKSDGTLLEMDLQVSQAPIEHDTHLRGKNDTEGIAYDRASNRLLIACKEDPGADLKKRYRAIYAFDLAQSTLVEEPVYVIDTDQLDLPRKVNFKPSAVAVHPTNGDVYVLSSTASMIVALRDGNISGSWPLSSDLFEQAEGLAFADDGTLYISSEGVDGPGVIRRYAGRSQTSGQ